MKKPIFIILSLVGIIMLLTITRAAVTNSLSTSGIDLTKLDREIDTYNRKIALLEEAVLHASSYTTLEEEAKKRGYESMSSQLVLSSQVPMAYNR